jgi:hypothetical protein
MDIYHAIRWGHAESPDGPGGEDTHLLLRAASLAEATRIADEALARLPVSSPLSDRPVKPYCQVLTLLGPDSGTKSDSRLLAGPWIGEVSIGASWYQCWSRDTRTLEWEDGKSVWPDYAAES